MGDEFLDPGEVKRLADENEFIINPLFEPLFQDSIDQPMYYQVFGGRGSGKSTAAAVAVIDLTYSKYGHKIMYLRATMTSMEDSSIEDIRTAIKDLGLSNDFRENKGKIINRVTGSTVTFKGIRSSGAATANLKSLSGITTVVFEEAEEIKSFEEFSMIDEGIRKKGVPLKIIMLYNPGSALSSWIHKEWFKNGKVNEERLDDTVFIHSTYLDNLENLNPKKVASYERYKKTNPVYYKNTILAEWTLDAQERVYADWDLIPVLDQEGDTWYGLDFSYYGKDHTACVKVTWIDGVYYAEEMFSESKQLITDTVRAMRDAGIPKNAKIFADSAMPLLIEEIKRKGYSGIKKCRKGRVEAEVKKVQDMDIRIVGNESSNLFYHNKTWQRTNGKIKDHEPDLFAALRYAVNSKKPVKPAKAKKRPAKRKKGFIGGNRQSSLN